MAVKIEIIGDYTSSASSSIRAAIKDVQKYGQSAADVAAKTAKATTAERETLAKLSAEWAAVAASAKKGSSEQVAAASLAADAQRRLAVQARETSAATVSFAGASEKASGRLRGMVGTVRSVAVSMLGLGAAVEGSRIFKASIDDAEAFNAAMRAEKQAIVATGGSFATYTGQVNTLASSGARLGYTNAQVLGGLKTLTLVTGNASDAVRYMGLTEDIAKAKGLDLSKVATAVGKFIDGKSASLQRYGIVAVKGQSIEDALTAAARRYAGQAQANTTVTEKLGAVVTNLETKIGNLLLPEVEHVATSFEHWISKSKNQEKVLGDVKTSVSTLADVVHKTVSVVQAIDKVTGSFTNTLKALLALKVASVMTGWARGFKIAGGGAAVAEGEVAGLLGALALIPAVVATAIIVTEVIRHEDQNITNAIGKIPVVGGALAGNNKVQTYQDYAKLPAWAKSEFAKKGVTQAQIDALPGGPNGGGLSSPFKAGPGIGALPGSQTTKTAAAGKNPFNWPTLKEPLPAVSFGGGGGAGGGGGGAKTVPDARVPAAWKHALTVFGEHISRAHLSILHNAETAAEKAIAAETGVKNKQGAIDTVKKGYEAAAAKLQALLAKQQLAAAKTTIARIEAEATGPAQALKLAQAAGQPVAVILADQNALEQSYRAEAAQLKAKLATAKGKAKATYQAALAKIQSSISSTEDAVASSLQSIAQAAQSKLQTVLGSIEQAADSALGAQFFQGTQNPLEAQLAAMQQADQLAGLKATLAAATTPEEKAAAQRQIDEFNLSIQASQLRAQEDKDYATEVFNLNRQIEALSANVGDGSTIQGDLNALLGQYGISLSTLADAGGNGLLDQLGSAAYDTTQAFYALTDALGGSRSAGASAAVKAARAGKPVALASGGLVTRPTFALVGESGPEAVVPLSGRGIGGGLGVTELHFHFPDSVIASQDQLVTMVRRGLLQIGIRNGTALGRFA